MAEDNIIDAHLFRDEDGKLYLYYVKIGDPFVIFVQPMSDPLTKMGQRQEVLRPSAEWEQRRGRVTEGPWMLKYKGTYYLMYSGSGAIGPEYAVGYATSNSPMGPFRKFAGNPIAKQGNGVYGPGHNCVIEDALGNLWMVYHQQNSQKIGWDRFLAIDPLWFDKEGVLHVKVTRGTDETIERHAR
ncbi:MAG: family 43 glycosylhydrolase [Planctomycetaceae bacterium]|nr:family 43 glycosylhydrolase [Planctomycetaceae bacterium]